MGGAALPHHTLGPALGRGTSHSSSKQARGPPKIGVQAAGEQGAKRLGPLPVGGVGREWLPQLSNHYSGKPAVPRDWGPSSSALLLWS